MFIRTYDCTCNQSLNLSVELHHWQVTDKYRSHIVHSSISFMTRRICGAIRWGGIVCALISLLLSSSRSIFASRAAEIEYVVIQGTACVDANRDATCSPNETGVPGVVVRSDGTVLMTTNATGRFSVRVPAQAVIEFELPAGYESATGELSTQVFESGRIAVPLTQQQATAAAVASPTATPIQPAATARVKATATLPPAKQSTPIAKPTFTPEPSATAALPTPTEIPSTPTPAPTLAATAAVAATASATNTATPAAEIILNSQPTALPTQPSKTVTTPVKPMPSFEEEAQPASPFSLGAIPRAVFVSVGLLLGLGVLIGWLAFRSNALKTNRLAGASSAGGYAAGSQVMVWEQGSSQQAIQTPQVPQLPSGREWHPVAQRLLNQAHLKSIVIDAEAGILAASTVPAPVFVLNGTDGNRLVFTIDPSLPVRSGLVADRSQVSRIAKFTGAGRGDAHILWRHVAQVRNLANPACPSWADWYLIVCQQADRPV